MVKNNIMPRMSPQPRQNQDEVLELFRPELLQRIIEEIKTDLNRRRSVRKKLLAQLRILFEKISFFLQQDSSLQVQIVENVEEWKQLILESTRLCLSLSLPENEIHEVYNDVYDVGTYLETVFIAIYTWCKNNSKLFGDYVVDFLTQLLELTEDKPAEWLHSVMISPLVQHTLNAFLCADHKELREDWARRNAQLMRKMPKAISDCGDFWCQYYLMNIVAFWVKWSPTSHAIQLINETFSFVPANFRKRFAQSEDPVLELRNFINALNTSTRGPNTVIPIACLYMFVGDTELKAPEIYTKSGIDFWVDFSIPSGRMHVFYSLPTSQFLALSIWREQVESVCLNWVINDGNEDNEDYPSMSSFGQTPASSVALNKHEKIFFIHIELNRDFEAISQDITSEIGKGCRSIYLAFQSGELAQRVLTEMRYNAHECGTCNCKRPKTLLQMLTSQNKLSYSRSWCPDSQVLNLDKSLSHYSGRGSPRCMGSDTSGGATRETSFSSIGHTPGRSFIESLSPEASLEHSRISKKFLGESKRSCESPFIGVPLKHLLRPSPKLHTNEADLLRTPEPRKEPEAIDRTPGATFMETPGKTPTGTPGIEFCKDLVRKSPRISRQNENFSGEMQARHVRNLSQEFPEIFEDLIVPEKRKPTKSPFQVINHDTPSAKYVRKKNKIIVTQKREETTKTSGFIPLKIVKTSIPKRTSKGTPVLIPPRTPIKSLSAGESPLTALKTIFDDPPTPGGRFIDSESQDVGDENSVLELEKRVQNITSTGLPPQASPVETPGGTGFYVSVSGSPSSSIHERSNLNITFNEDPLPPEARGKYGGLTMHSPFTPIKRFDRGEESTDSAAASPVTDVVHDNIILCSSQKSNAIGPVSPGVSEICAPLKDVLNITAEKESEPLFSLSPVVEQNALPTPEDSEEDDNAPLSPALNQHCLTDRNLPQPNRLVPERSVQPQEILHSATPTPPTKPVESESNKSKRKKLTKKRSTPKKNSAKNSSLSSSNPSIFSSTESEPEGSPVYKRGLGFSAKTRTATPKKVEPPPPPPKNQKVNLDSSSQRKHSPGWTVAFSESEEEENVSLPVLPDPKTPPKKVTPAKIAPTPVTHINLDFSSDSEEMLSPVLPRRASPRAVVQTQKKSPLPSPIMTTKKIRRMFESPEPTTEKRSPAKKRTPPKKRSPPKTHSPPKKRSPPKEHPVKIPCYHNAFQQEAERTLRKSEDPDFDIYELWTSSEMDLYRQKLFPPVKTYPGKKRSKAEHQIAAKKNSKKKRQSEDENKKLFLKFEKMYEERKKAKEKRKAAAASVNPSEKENGREEGKFKIFKSRSSTSTSTKRTSIIRRV